jgi:hypothetical protein
MRQSGARPDRHNGRKTTTSPAKATYLVFQVARDLLFGLIRLQLSSDHPQCSLSDSDRSPYLGHFGRILDLPQLFYAA